MTYFARIAWQTKGSKVMDEKVNTTHGERSPERHPVAHKWQPTSDYGSAKCSLCPQHRDHVIHDVSIPPQPQPEAALCPGCGHEQRFFDGEQCNFIVDTATDKACGHKCKVEAPAVAGTPLTWDLVLSIARGCADYGGGYRSDDAKLAIFHHGIQTVVNALQSASQNGLHDTQVAALYRIGKEISHE